MPSEMGDDINIFTHALWNHYSSPSGIAFDVLNPGFVNIVDDPTSPDYNVDHFGKILMDDFEDRAKSYLTDEVLCLFGDDFNYIDAM